MTTLIKHFLDSCESRRAFLTSLAAVGIGAAGSAATGWAFEGAVSGVTSVSQSEEGSKYLFAHVTLKPGTTQQFTAALEKIAPLFEKHGGWKLQACFREDGTDSTIIDVWEIPNAEAVQKNLSSVPNDPDFALVVGALGDCIESETLRVMTKQPVLIA